MKSLRCAIGIHSWAYNYLSSPMTRSCHRCSKNQYLGSDTRHFPAPWLDGEPPPRATLPPNTAAQLHASHNANEKLRRARAEDSRCIREQRRIDANSPVPGDPTWPFHSAFPNDYSAPQSPVPGRFEGLGGTFDGGGASADWSTQSGGSCDSSPSPSSCDSCSSSSSDSGGSTGGGCD